MSNFKHTFQVGDGASFGFNGDHYPCTVVKVTPTRVYIQRDLYECVKRPSAYGAGDGEYKFIPNPNEQVEMFSFKKSSGRITDGTFILSKGRHFAQNPHF